MNIVALGLVGVGAVAMGAGAAIQRRIVQKDDKLFHESEVLVGQNLVAAAIGLLFVFPFWTLFGGPVLRGNAILFWGALGLWFCANVGVQLAGVYASKYAPVGLTLPYQAVTPGLLTLAVFLLGERPSQWGYIGIALIAVGTYIHGRLGAGSFWAYFTPLWRVLFLPANYGQMTSAEQQQVRDERKGVRCAALSAFCGTFGLLSEGLAARHGNPVVALVVGSLLLTGWSMLWHRWKRAAEQAAQPLAPLSERLAKQPGLLVLRGITQALAVFCPMAANRLAPIAYVGSLKRLAIPIGVLMSQRLFAEQVSRGRWVTVTIITIGALLLAIDNTPAYLIDVLDLWLKP